jgi:signal transduction histidine kinase
MATGYTERYSSISTMCTITRSDEILHSLVHDLRQPLGNLETSLFFLEMVLDHPSDRVREQMRIMARQVAQAAQLLERAGEELRVAPGHLETAGSDSLPFTKSATAVVT